MNMKMGLLEGLSEHERRIASRLVLLCQKRIPLEGEPFDVLELDQKNMTFLDAGAAPLFDIPPVLEALKRSGFVEDFWIGVGRNQYPQNPYMVDIDETNGKRHVEVSGWRRDIRCVDVVVLFGIEASNISDLYGYLSRPKQPITSKKPSWFITKRGSDYYFKEERITITPKTAAQITLDALVELDADQDGVITYEAIARHAMRLNGNKPLFSSVKRTRNCQISHAIGEDQGFLYIGRIGSEQRRLSKVVRLSQILKNVRGKGYQFVWPRSTKK